LILCAWGGATRGAAPDDGAAAPSSATRQPPPAPPIKYLEAGARLYNSAQDSEQLKLASKYLEAANTYRDQLQPDEQATLDAYLKELAKAKAEMTAASTAPAANPTAAVQPAAAARPPASVTAGTQPYAAVAGNPAGPNQTAATVDTKQRGRWLLHEAWEQLHLGNYDAAQRKAMEADALDIKWGLFEDTPAKVAEEIKKARPKAVVSKDAGSAQPHDRRAARAKLRAARAALENRQFEQAEAVALDVKAWGLSYGLFEDNPDKVAAAARALRRRDKIRNTSPREQSSQGVYDILVQESRQLISVGKLDDAEAKARQAQRMNVVPSLTADRAESVLHEIAMARAQKAPTIATTMPSPVPPGPVAGLDTRRGRLPAPIAIPDSPSVTAEREANELLAKGDQAAAVAKFTEAERLSASESTPTAPAGIALTPVADPAVRQIATSEPGPAPDLAAPADDPVGQKPVAAPPTTLEPPVAAATPNQAQPDAGAAAPAAPASLGAEPVTASPKPANRGDQLLSEAQAIYKVGNFAAAKDLANQAKAGKFGVDVQADELIAQISLSEQGGALGLYQTALAALRSGDNGRARSLLKEVAAAGDSLDDNLRAKVEGLLQKLSTDDKGKPEAKSGTNAAQDAEALAAQRLNAEVGTKIAEGRRLHETDPDKAIALYEQTVQAVQAAGLSPDLSRPMVRRLEVAIEIAKKDKVEFERKMQDKQLRAEIETKRLRILEADKAKKTRMKELMDKAMKAYAEGSYVECEAFAKRAMEVDPNELAASMLVYKAKAERRFKQDQLNRGNKDEANVLAFQAVDLAAIADPEVQLRDISFPKTFKDLTRDRLAMNAKLEPKKDPKVLTIESKLKDRVSVNMDKQPLSEAVTFLQNYTGLNIVLDPKALGEEGLTSASPVSLVVNQIQLKTALKLMLRPLGLTYKVEDEVVLITSPQATQSQTYPKTYYVGDLVMPPDNGAQNRLPHTLMAQPPQSDPNGAGIQTQGVFGALDPRSAQALSGLGSTKGDRPSVDLMPLIQLITTSIAPGTWKVQDGYGHDVSSAYGMGGGFGGDAGGGLDQGRQPGAIVPFFLSISLIIKHTAEVHEQVADLLRQLRRLQDLQVSVEVRFITVNDTFFEQIGVDFDFQIQSDTVGKHSTFAIPNPAVALLATASSTSTTTSTSTATGGTTGGTGGGTTGGGGGTTGGGGGGGTTGGGGGGGAAGGTGGGGGAAGGTGGGTTGGSTSGQVEQPVYLVNPFRDHAYPNTGPLVVGTQGGGIANFSPNLNIPYTGPQASLVQSSQFQQGAGATFGIAFLSDLEVYLFLTAAQGDTRSNVLQAPKVTTFNGAAATIFNNVVQYYIQSLTPIVGPGAVAYSPTIGLIPSGVTLTVTPVVSADRRYVRMTLTPFFNALNSLQTFTFPGGAVGGSGLGGAAAVISTTVQLPNTTTTTITTTVTVPDGGTVLLGGVKNLMEERTEFGVPVVSKIPLLDRLFRNVGIGRTTNSVMLMVTPRIIILEEEEEKLGIPSVAL